jgi:hypothetical protein
VAVEVLPGKLSAKQHIQSQHVMLCEAKVVASSSNSPDASSYISLYFKFLHPAISGE